MVLRAKDPKRSALSSCAGPKTRRKSPARKLPSLLAAIAVIVFTGHPQDSEMLSFCEETGRRKTPASRLPDGFCERRGSIKARRMLRARISGDCGYDIRKFVLVFGSPSGTQGGELVQESSSRL